MEIPSIQATEAFRALGHQDPFGSKVRDVRERLGRWCFLITGHGWGILIFWGPFLNVLAVIYRKNISQKHQAKDTMNVRSIFEVRGF